MFKNEDIPQNRKMLGYYLVNNQVYLNKYHALENCRNGEWPQWVFHDDTYSKVDWDNPPKESLSEVYKQRAIQLRGKYDNVLLYYSGGIDSHAVLHAFVDNDIKIDGIIVSGSFSLNTSVSKTCNSEQTTIALPYLEKLKAENKLKCPIYALDTVKYHKFEDENWVYACGQSLSPQVYSYNFFWQEPWIQDFLMKGKTCFVRGVDKPRIILDENDNWQVGFLDAYIMSGTPTGHLSKNQNWDIQEYFYWSPDSPDVLNKQINVCIDWFEKNLSKTECQRLTTKESSFPRSEYNKYIDPLVYSDYLTQKPGEDRNYFTLNKPFSANVWHKDLWFLENKELHKKDFNAWMAGLEMLSKKIPAQYFNKSLISDEKQLFDKFLQTYNIQSTNVANEILLGSVGTWAKFHLVRKYKSPAR
jgi:hypothetical protein